MPRPKKKDLSPSSVAARLRELRGHLTQQGFSEKTGISKSLIAMVEAGERAITPSMVERLSVTFPSLSMAWLLSGEGAQLLADDAEAPSREVGKLLDLYGRATGVGVQHPVARCRVHESAVLGLGTSFDPQGQRHSSEFGLPVGPFLYGHEYHLARAFGDSMEPAIFSGDWVLIDATQTDPLMLAGHVVAANLEDHQGEGSTVKVLRRTRRGYQLEPINPAHPCIDNFDTTHIVGRVVSWFDPDVRDLRQWESRRAILLRSSAKQPGKKPIPAKVEVE